MPLSSGYCVKGAVLIHLAGCQIIQEVTSPVLLHYIIRKSELSVTKYKL
jgi:hypothetical protein